MDLGLTGKRILVTGGASGLGAALTRALVAEGANVAVNYRSRQGEAQALVDESEGGVTAIQADLADSAQVSALFAQAVERLGGLDVLVNNAGVWLTCSVGTITERDWDLSIDVNLKAPMLLSQMFVEHCTGEGRTGRILNVTSQAAFRGSSTGHIPYAAAKGGLVTLTRSMARELGPCGVTVNAIAIGMMDSPMVAKALEERREYYEAQIPIGYVAAPADIADIAVFLVSERAKYMTGATVDVSGGQLMH